MRDVRTPECDPEFGAVYEGMFAADEAPQKKPLAAVLKAEALTERQIVRRGYGKDELRLLLEKKEIERWDFLTDEPLYYKGGTDEEPTPSEEKVLASIEGSLRPPNHTFDDVVYEAMTKMPKHVAHFNFIRSFINANPVRLYRTMHYLIESGRLDGWLTRGEKAAIEEAKICPISETDVKVLDAGRLVKLTVLSRAGEGYSYSYCTGLVNVLAESGLKGLNKAVAGEEPSFSQKQRLRSLGLTDADGGLTPFGKECLSYLRACSIDPRAYADYADTLKAFYNNWKQASCRQTDRPAALLNAARVLEKWRSTAEKKTRKTAEDAAHFAARATSELEYLQKPGYLQRHLFDAISEFSFTNKEESILGHVDKLEKAGACAHTQNGGWHKITIKDLSKLKDAENLPSDVAHGICRRLENRAKERLVEKAGEEAAGEEALRSNMHALRDAGMIEYDHWNVCVWETLRIVPEEERQAKYNEKKGKLEEEIGKKKDEAEKAERADRSFYSGERKYLEKEAGKLKRKGLMKEHDSIMAILNPDSVTPAAVTSRR